MEIELFVQVLTWICVIGAVVFACSFLSRSQQKVFRIPEKHVREPWYRSSASSVALGIQSRRPALYACLGSGVLLLSIHLIRTAF